MITYAIENPAEIISEITSLLNDNWEETGEDLPFNPDVVAYQSLFEAGAMKALVVRDGEKVVAYCTILIMPNLHSKEHIEGVNDALFVDKKYRKTPIPYRLIRQAEIIAKDSGATTFNWHCRQGTPLGATLEKRGYTLLSAIAAKGI